MDKSGTRRDWDQFGGSSGNSGNSAYPSGPPDFTKQTSGRVQSSDAYSSSQAMSGAGADSGQPFDGQYTEQAPPTGIMGHVATATETAKVAALNAVEGGKNLARQASEGAKNLASGAWDKISSLTGPKP